MKEGTMCAVPLCDTILRRCRTLGGKLPWAAKATMRYVCEGPLSLLKWDEKATRTQQGATQIVTNPWDPELRFGWRKKQYVFVAQDRRQIPQHMHGTQGKQQS